VRASGSGSPPLRRYGHNDPAIALGRKNHLFAGSDGGGARWAVVSTLVETAKMNGVEPYAYLRDVLERMVEGHPINRLDELLPWAWKAENPVNS
jgi:transposase